MHQEYIDIINIIQSNPGIKSADICEKMEAMGYYANQRQPTEHVAKRLGYLKNNGHIIGEKMSTPTGPKNHWTIAPPKVEQEVEMASDVAELQVVRKSDNKLFQSWPYESADETGVESESIHPTPDEMLTFLQVHADARQVGGSHYLDMPIEPWKVMEAWFTKDQLAGFMLGNTLKYIARSGRKGGREDIEKAAHYLQKYLEVTA